MLSAWVAQGPSPTINAQLTVSPSNNINGGIQAIAAHPTDANTLYAGTVNGGVWKTTDATAVNPTWTPLTDSLQSQSIGDIQFDATDGTSQTLIVGTGRLSNFAQRGDDEIGVYYTTNGGSSWSVFSPANLQNQKIMGVAARGSILMAGSNTSGLFRSTNGGTSWTNISGTSGLSAGSIFSLVSDPGNTSRFYTAVSGVGVFRTDDTGASWTNVTAGLTGATTSPYIRLAVNASASVVYAAVPGSGAGVATRVFRSVDQGANWTAMDTFLVHNGGQQFPDTSLAASPTDANIVYLAGDRISGSPFTSLIARGDATLGAGAQWTTIVNGNTSDGSTPHADTRDMEFLADGSLLEADDGGIYNRSTPTSSAGSWRSIGGNIQAMEVHDVAWNAITNTIVIGVQDNGTHQQPTTGSTTWNWFNGGDGGDVAVDSVSLAGSNQAIRYYSSQNLGGFRRQVTDISNNIVSTTNLATIADPQFVTPIEINTIDPTRLLIGGVSTLYESFNQGTTNASIGGPGANRVAMVYGGSLGGTPNADLIYVGKNAQVWKRTAPGSLAVTTALPAGASTITDVGIDPDNYNTVFAVDNNQVFLSANGGSTWSDITGNLATVSPGLDLRTVEYVSGANGYVAVGTRSGVFASLAGSLGTWVEVGATLPDALVFDLEYNATDNILVAGTLGRSVWTLSNANNEFNPADTGVTLASGVLTITDVNGGTSNDQLVMSYSGGTYTITDTGGLLLTTAIAGATGDGTSTLTIPDTGVTGILFDTLGGDDTITVNSVQSSLTSGFTIIGGTGVDSATINGAIAVTGSGAVDITVSKNIALTSGSSVTTVDGNLTLNANQQLTATGGNFFGIHIDAATLTTSGAGNILIEGRGGDSGSINDGIRLINGARVESTATGATAGTITLAGTGGAAVSFNVGVVIYSAATLITSRDGDILITGIGGSDGTDGANSGLDIDAATISSTGTGANAALISIIGTGGNGTYGNHGTLMAGNATITSVDGDIDIIGVGGTGTTVNNLGVLMVSAHVSSTGTDSNAAAITITGTQGPDGNGPRAIYLFGSASLTTTDAPITLICDSIVIDPTPTINAGMNTVTLRQKTNGTAINLGGADGASLGLTDAELDRVTAGTVQIGNANSGAITFSANVDRAVNTNVNLTTGANNNIAFGTFSLSAGSGGDVSLTTSGTGAITTGDNTGSDLTADDVTLNAGSNGIGSTTNFLRLAATTVTATTSGNGGISLVEADSVTIASDGLSAGTATITLGAGTFTLGGSDRIDNASDVNVAGGAKLGLSTFNETIDQLILNDGSVDGSGTLTGGSTFDVQKGSINAKLAGSVGLTKTTASTVDLFGANTYTGATAVTVGTLAINGSVTSNVTVTSPGVLNGVGTITGNVSGTGTFSPGNSPGTMTIVGNFTPTGTVNFEVNNPWTTPGTDFDRYLVTGMVDLSGATLTFSNTDDTTAPAAGTMLKIIDNDGTGDPTTASTSPAQGATVTIGTRSFTIFYNGGDGNDVILATPEASSFVVSTVSDVVDAFDGFTSLREAILYSNSNAGTDTISFNIAGAGVHTIQPASPLPGNTDAVIIDGTTQPGVVSTPLIELDGTNAGAGALGLKITGGGSTVKGLAINRFSGAGIRLVNGNGNLVDGNLIGTNATGTADQGNAGDGIQIINSDTNTIGGTTAADRNVISGNERYGVSIDAASTGNVIEGNLIGTNLAGTGDLGNTLSGVLILSASNTIGGTTAGAGNVISGNDQHGVFLTTAAVTSNLIQGNYIGTDVNGTSDLGNTLSGVQIDNGAASNTIGGTTVAARNVISGNNGYGVRLQGFGTTTNNNVQGNYIGTDVNGTTAIGNSLSGVQVSATGNTIGGTAAGAGNLISGNVQHGVLIQGGSNVANLVQGNFIGTSAAGTADLGNTLDGVQVLNSSGNTIGGTTAAARNIISGNNENGVHLLGSFTTGTAVQGNYIGTNAAGTADLGNTLSGVLITSQSNTIGGTAAGAGNVISGNDRFGITILGVTASGNNVQQNLIGTNAAGTGAVGNSLSGITLYNVDGITIGGTTASARNVISGNVQNGVYLTGNGTSSNVLAGNYIGTDINGTADLGNTLSGVLLDNGAYINTIGGTTVGARNIISGNNQHGIHLLGFGLSSIGVWNNLIQGNYIGTDVNGTADLGNSLNGVMVQATANTIGGAAAGAGNLISGNDKNGVQLQGGVNAATLVQGNFIGTQLNGTSALGNSQNGVQIVNSSGNTIGGVAVGSGNTIAFNTQDGVAVTGTDVAASNNAILSNSTFSNGDLGIDLNGDGQTLNDTNDPDQGANHLQNTPVMSASIVLSGANLNITYWVPTLAANAAFPLRIEFFIADTNNQEGKTFLGTVNYAASDAPGAKLATISAGTAVSGTKIVATATDGNGNTSEFSLFATVA